MRGQLYHEHANATALSGSTVVRALGSKLDNPGSSPGQGKALCPWDMRGKKMQAPLLGLAKSIYYYRFTAFHRCISVSCLCQDTKNVDIFILVSSQSDQHLIFPYNITPGSHINPLTPMSDQDRISPYNINTVSIR